MSGGHFDYKQYELSYIADEIEELIFNNSSDEKNEWGDTIGRHYDKNTIIEFMKAVELIRKAKVYVHRIDWLVSGDDGEDSFHNRLASDLKKLEGDQE